MIERVVERTGELDRVVERVPERGLEEVARSSFGLEAERLRVVCVVECECEVELWVVWRLVELSARVDFVRRPLVRSAVTHKSIATLASCMTVNNPTLGCLPVEVWVRCLVVVVRLWVGLVSTAFTLALALCELVAVVVLATWAKIKNSAASISCTLRLTLTPLWLGVGCARRRPLDEATGEAGASSTVPLISLTAAGCMSAVVLK